MFALFKQYVKKTCTTITTQLGALFAKQLLVPADVAQIKQTLLQSDVGEKITQRIIETLQEKITHNGASGAVVKEMLVQQIVALVRERQFAGLKPVIIFVGANGTGKTTTIAKIAHMLRHQNKKILLAAADTFRAAAVEQLAQWGSRVDCAVIRGIEGQDPAAVAYKACEQFKRDSYDYLLIDTAGRLQTKTNLMNELGKLVRVVKKQVGADQVTILLTIDGMLGQNSFEQASLFHACVCVDGVILTKMDGSGKGGVVLAVVQDLGVPVAFVTAGEELSSIEAFDADGYVNALFN